MDDMREGEKMLRFLKNVCLCMILTGCTSVINRPIVLDTNPATSVSLDAKQRMVIAIDKGNVDGTKSRTVCAEASPDAVVGIASAIAAGANVAGKGEINASASLAEAIKTVGRRTQTVQLLRDGLYRACEAFMNGAISPEEYRALLKGIDAFAVALVAIDGLTGGQGVATPAVDTEAGAGDKSGRERTTTAKAVPGTAGSSTTEAPIPEANARAVVDITKAFLEFKAKEFEFELESKGVKWHK
jgi:hypothetical protein